MDPGEVKVETERRGLGLRSYTDAAHDQPIVPESSSARTLLPWPAANLVSVATRTSTNALRFSTFAGGLAFRAAKFTTLGGLDLTRGVLEGILSRSGKDVLDKSKSELGKAETESVLEKSLELLHTTMTSVVFWTTASFNFTETTVSGITQLSYHTLSFLDQFFGSTDSSKAIASIVTLIRREFQNPATGVQGERVGVIEIIYGLAGLAYLQNCCRKQIQAESRQLGHEVIIWDVVVLDDGARIDVHQDSLYGVHKGSYEPIGAGNTEDDVLGVVEQRDMAGIVDDDDLPDDSLKRHILESLPKHANVSITTSTTTTKTITVEIRGASEFPLLPPPGADLVETEIRSRDDESPDDPESFYRVVYRMSRNKVKNSSAPGQMVGILEPAVEVVDDADGLDEGEAMRVLNEPPMEDERPPVPPKPTHFISLPKNPNENTQSEGIVGASEKTSNAASPSAESLSSVQHRPTPVSTSASASENTANQKRARHPPHGTESKSPELIPFSRVNNRPAAKRFKDSNSSVLSKAHEKKGGLRNAFKKTSSKPISGILSKESSSENLTNANKSKSSIKPPWGSNKSVLPSSGGTQPRGSVPDRSSSLVPARDAPRAPQRGNPNHFTSRDLGDFEDIAAAHRSSSRASYTSVIKQRRDSVVSQTDTFSIHSYGSRPSSPNFTRNELRGPAPGSKVKPDNDQLVQASPGRIHRRARSQIPSMYSPSIYTLQTGSQTSLVLSAHQPQSAFSDSEAVDTLRRDGMVDGMYPSFHILKSISRYSRYASAAYGSNFLKFMGISKEAPKPKASEKVPHELRMFAHHTELPSQSILLSSFVDPQGGTDATGSTDTGVPLVHTVAIDEEAKAVVLACRGTLGLEDILTDIMCDYDDLTWRGRSHKVHKGIHASARRLLYGDDGRVLYILKEALEEFPDYGLILCGHSLGGGVTALLGVMLAEPAKTGTSFVTSAEPHSRLLTNGNAAANKAASQICLPPGRPIHVYAYGPPATMSLSLQRATRGLITSTVNGNDLVPYLSLGVLHDFQAVALAFKTDNSAAKEEVARRLWGGVQSSIANRWYNNLPLPSTTDDDLWTFAALKELRANMVSPKLFPPGEVFAVQSKPVLRREAFMLSGEEQFGKPAKRIVFKYIRDVEQYFKEVKFGSSMLVDHAPGRYEESLRRLMTGVLGSI